MRKTMQTLFLTAAFAACTLAGVTVQAEGNYTSAMIPLLSGSECRGIASGDKSWCSTNLCRAIASGDKSWCDDNECRGIASGDKSWCNTAQCRAIASHDKSWCP